MGQEQTIDRRVHNRDRLAMNFRFHHDPSDRVFPARSVDVSAGGMLMNIPAVTPVQVGQPIHLNLHNPATQDSAHAGIRAVIVRVDRAALLTRGYIAIAVQFEQDQPSLVA